MKNLALVKKTALSKPKERHGIEYIKKGLILLTLTTTILFSSCYKTAKVVHPEMIGQYLEQELGPGCVGMQYAIAKGGNLAINKAIGKAGLASNGVDIDYHKFHRKSVHSCSKTITAAALMHVLKGNQVSVDAEIKDYLPSRWDTKGIDGVTFRELLTHTSGFRGTRDTYASMRSYIEAGVFQTKGYSYANVNYSLMRILIPNINSSIRTLIENVFASYGEIDYAETVSNLYVSYVRDNILVPAELSPNVAPKIWDQDQFPTPLYHYNFANQSITGYSHSDQTLLTGAGGWYMNAKEYTGFIVYATAGEIPGLDFSQMEKEELGLYNVTKYGATYYTHNGASPVSNGRGGYCVWVNIPATQTVMVVQVNSRNNTFNVQQLEQTMIEAYLASIY